MAGKCPEDREDEFIADAAVLSIHDLGAKYNRAPSTMREWRVDLYRRNKLLWYPGIAVCEPQVYDDYIELEGDAVIVSDLEVPYHDPVLLGYAVSIGKKFGIKRLVIAGDFLANDAIGFFASQAEDMDVGVRFTVADSLLAGREVLSSLFMWFDHIVLIKGNHEQRGNRIAELGFFNMMRDYWEDFDSEGKLEISYYKWCRIAGRRVEHPTFRKVPGSIARERAEIEDEPIMAAHTHGFSYSFTKNGKHECVDLGHCTRPETRFYKEVNGVTPHYKWVAGFWIVYRDHVYGFPKEFTDWSFWLRDITIGGKKEEDST